VPHLANASACLAIIIDAMASDKLIDDRPPAQPGLPQLLADMETHVFHRQEIFKDRNRSTGRSTARSPPDRKPRHCRGFLR